MKTAIKPTKPNKTCFNTDLLLHKNDLTHAKEKYPTVYHVLDFPELRQFFQSIDKPANRAKQVAQKAGFYAVILAALSLGFAASAPAWSHLPFWLVLTFSLIASFAGIVSILIAGAGLLYGSRKQDWLLSRLQTERTRQFFFQTFTCKVSEIAASITNEATKQQFADNRKLWFKNFRAEFDPERWLSSKYHEILDANVYKDAWVLRLCSTSEANAGLIPEELFEAYYELRIKGQLEYANYKLGNNDSALSFWRMSLVRKRNLLRFISWFSLATLAILEVLSVVGILTGVIEASSHIPHIIVIWLALISLGARTVEGGMALEPEIERYSDYRAQLSDIEHRFRHANDPQQKIEIMKEMEIVSFEEMKRFLRQQNEASFVM